jgi:hypothetical protein
MAAVSGTDFRAATLADPDTAEGGGRAGQARYSFNVSRTQFEKKNILYFVLVSQH